jgi:DNA-binding transcriptional MerR regulator
MTAEELCVSCGVTQDLIDDLESYGLLVPAMLGGVRTYDAEAQLVARAAARCVELGVEPRHLRMYKVAAEREAGFIEQLVMPLLKLRNPTSREQALERTDELLGLGAELHASLLRRQMRVRGGWGGGAGRLPLPVAAAR